MEKYLGYSEELPNAMSDRRTRREALSLLGSAGIATIASTNSVSADELPEPRSNPRRRVGHTLKLTREKPDPDDEVVVEHNSTLAWHGVQEGIDGSYDHVFTLTTNAGAYKKGNQNKKRWLNRTELKLSPDSEHADKEQHYVNPNTDDAFFQVHPGSGGATELSGWFDDAVEFTANAASLASKTFGQLWSVHGLISAFEPATGGRWDGDSWRFTKRTGRAALPYAGWQKTGHTLRFTISVPDDAAPTPTVESYTGRAPDPGEYDGKDIKSTYDVIFYSDGSRKPLIGADGSAPLSDYGVYTVEKNDTEVDIY